MQNLTCTAPTIRDLTRQQIDGLLERNHVGRLAFSFHDRVDIRPIHYVFRDGWLFGRTSPGDKLVKLKHNQWIAFEVDEIAGPLDWQSVVIHGTFYALHAEDPHHVGRLYERALETIRQMSTDVLGDQDPLAFRTVIFGIHVDSATGRSSSTVSER